MTPRTAEAMTKLRAVVEYRLVASIFPAAAAELAYNQT